MPRGWRRAVALRRLAAGVLLVAAGVLALAGARSPAVAGTPVVVAAADLAPGRTVGPDDVVVRSLPPAAVPAGAVGDPGGAMGRQVVGAVRAGEVLTDVRLVGAEAARAAVGAGGGPAEDAAGVPLRLADPAVAALVRPGSVVDVVGGGATRGAAGGASGEDAGGPEVLAGGARVITVLPAPEGASSAGSAPVVVVGLSGPDAARVAAATVGREVTLTLR